LPVDPETATFGQVPGHELATGRSLTGDVDYVEIAGKGAAGETLYVSSAAIAESLNRNVIMPAITREGDVLGYLHPGIGLILNGQTEPAVPIAPPTTG